MHNYEKATVKDRLFFRVKDTILAKEKLLEMSLHNSTIMRENQMDFSYNS